MLVHEEVITNIFVQLVVRLNQLSWSSLVADEDSLHGC